MRLHPAFCDVLFCVLVVFIALAMQAGSSRSDSERHLPPVGLPRVDSAAATGATGRRHVNVSIVQGGGALSYLIEDEPAASADALVRRLLETGTARQVLLRAGAGVPYGDFLQLLAGLTREGFEVALAYEEPGRGRNAR